MVLDAVPVASMESGLEGRNNQSCQECRWHHCFVSMESGLEGRNNRSTAYPASGPARLVSMESGLEGRNNPDTKSWLDGMKESQWSPA